MQQGISTPYLLSGVGSNMHKMNATLGREEVRSKNNKSFFQHLMSRVH